jgi:hypothetical protein
MKTYWGSGGIIPRMKLCARWSGQLHAPASISPVPIWKEDGWARKLVWTYVFISNVTAELCDLTRCVMKWPEPCIKLFSHTPSVWTRYDRPQPVEHFLLIIISTHLPQKLLFYLMQQVSYVKSPLEKCFFLRVLLLRRSVSVTFHVLIGWSEIFVMEHVIKIL